MEIVLNGPWKVNVRGEIRAASSTIQQKRWKGKRRTPHSPSNDMRRNSKVTEKEMPQESAQRYQSVRKVKQGGTVPFSKGAMPKGIRMWLLAPTRMLTPQSQKWIQMEDKWVFKRAGNASDDRHRHAFIAIQLEPAKELNWSSNMIDSEENRMATDTQTIRHNYLRGFASTVVSVVWKRITNCSMETAQTISVGRTKKRRIRFSNQRLRQELFLPDRNSHEEKECIE